MKNIIAVCVLVLGFWYYREHAGPTTVSSALTQSPECLSKKYCVLVYVAPWCPACKQYAPFLKQALSGLKHPAEVGMKVIMGMERSPGDNEREARMISDKVVIDHDHKISHDLQIEHYPTFLVVGPDQKIMMKDQAAFEWLQKEI